MHNPNLPHLPPFTDFHNREVYPRRNVPEIERESTNAMLRHHHTTKHVDDPHGDRFAIIGNRQAVAALR